MAEAGHHLSELLGTVHETKEAVVVERDGVPYAVVISPEQYAGLPDEDALDWEAIDQVAAQNADKDPEAVQADVTATVEAVRQEVYDERSRATRRH